MNNNTTHEKMEFDVIIVGAGPAGLASAIKLASINKTTGKSISVCVLEKGSEVGAHILSGAVLEPKSLEELIPNFIAKNADLFTKVKQDKFLFLTKNASLQLPTPKQMQNHGNYIISLGNLCRKLAIYAESLGVEIYPAFPASEILYDEAGKVVGVATKDLGIAKDGSKKSSFQAGMHLYAKQVIVADGARGSISKEIINKFNLRQNSKEQTYGIGIKELWEVDNKLHNPGEVIHTVGWPLDFKTYGGSFLYHMNDKKIALGFVIGLDYQNPTLDPHAELQRFKHHPKIKDYFANGKLISYGARALTEGGLQSLPKLTFPGGVLVGCAAGLINVPKIKGIHNAIKSGIIAANCVFKELNSSCEVVSYNEKFKQSSVYTELQQVRNIRPGFKYGLWFGLLNAAFETYISYGKSPWTLSHHIDNKCLRPKDKIKKINYPKPDNILSFDKTYSVSFSNTNHGENQPCHLQLTDPNIAIDVNYEKFGSPEGYYCPAKVYEIVENDNGEKRLQINSQNCVHCKTCDIKDPTQNITWVVPEGGDGPNYPDM